MSLSDFSGGFYSLVSTVFFFSDPKMTSFRVKAQKEKETSSHKTKPSPHVVLLFPLRISFATGRTIEPFEYVHFAKL